MSSPSTVLFNGGPPPNTDIEQAGESMSHTSTAKLSPSAELVEEQDPLLSQSIPDEEIGDTTCKRYENFRPSVRVVCLLSIVAVLERVAYSTIIVAWDYELQLTDETPNRRHKYRVVMTEEQLDLYNGVCYFLPFLGGILTDAFIGRYWSILIGAVFYIAGGVILSVDCPLISWEAPEPYCRWDPLLTCVPMFVVSIGQALVKTSLYPFFVDQLVGGIQSRTIAIEKIFAWIYSMFALGEMSSYIITTFIVKPLPFTPPIVSICVTILGVLFFLAGTDLYVIRQKQGHVISGIIRLIVLRLSTCCCRKRQPHVSTNRHKDYPQTPTPIKKDSSKVSDATFTLRQIGVVFPVFGTLLLTFCVYPQAGLLLRHLAKRNSTDLNRITLITSNKYYLLVISVVSVIGIIIPVLVFCVVLPVIIRCNKRVTCYQKLGACNIFITLCVAVGLVLNVVMETYGHCSFGSGSRIAYESVMTLLFFTANSLIVVTGSAISYREAPDGLEVMFNGLFLCTCGVGGLLGSIMFKIALLPSVTNFLRHTIWYFVVLFALLLVNITYIVLLSYKHPLHKTDGVPYNEPEDNDTLDDPGDDPREECVTRRRPPAPESTGHLMDVTESTLIAGCLINDTVGTPPVGATDSRETYDYKSYWSKLKRKN